MAKKKAAPPKQEDKLDLILGALTQLVQVLGEKNKQEKEDDVDEPATTTTKRRGRATKRQSTSNGRVNRFEEMEEFTAHKEDTKVDKKLWKGKRPTPRREHSNRVEIQCSECPRKIQVLPQEVAMGTRYRCNDCIRKRAGGSN